MTSSTLIYFISILLTFALTGLLAWYAWRQRPVLPGVRMYAWLALAECLLSLDEILSMTSATLAQAHFFFNLRFLFTGIISVFFLVFALEYLGHKDWITRPLLSAVFIIPAISQLFIWIPGLNGLWVKQDVGFHQNGPFWVSDTSLRVPGVWFLVHSFYGLAFLLVGIVLILLVAWRQRRQQRGQALLLASGAMVALITALIPVLNLFPQLAFNPFILGIGISAGLYALAVFRFQFLKRSPAQESPGSINIPRLEESHSLAAFIFFFILFATGIAAIGVASYQKYEEQFRLQVNDQLTAVAALKVNQLESWRTERLGDANMFILNPAFSALVQQYYDNPADTQVQFQMQAWLADFQNYYHYVSVFLLDTHGVEQVSAPAGHQPVSAYLAGQASTALELSQATFVDFYRDTPSGPIRLALLAPIFAGGLRSHPLGVVILNIDPEVSLYPFIQEWPTPSTTAETLLVRRDGNTVQYLNALKFQPNAALNLRIPLANTGVLAVKAALGQTGIVQGTDYRGVPAVGYVGAVPGSPWFMVARMDTAEVYAPLRQRLWEMLVFFGLLILAAGAGLLLIWRQQGLRYYRAQLGSLDALRLSEEKFRSLFNNAEVGMYRTRLDGSEILDMNDKYLEIFGRTRAEMQGSNSASYWADPQERQEFVHQLEAQGRIVDFECRMLNKPGEVRRCLTSARLFPENGILEGSLLDITERKQTEESLRTSRAELDAALASMTDAVFISDAEGQFINFNEAFATFHKFKSKAECAKTLTDYPAFLDVFKANGELAPLEQWAVSRALRGETGTNVEYSLRRKDTGDTWVGSYSFAPIRDRDGVIVGSVVVARDITESKRAAQALLTSESRYRELVQNANSAILRWRRDGSILFFNEYAQTLFGYAAEEAIGRNVNMLLPETESTGGDLTGLVTDMLEYPERFVNQVNENICRDGRRVWMNWTNKPILDEFGKVSEILAVGNDITEHKRTEAQLVERHATLNAILESSATPVFSLDRFYRYTSFNSAHASVMKALYGAEIEIGQSMLDYQVVPEDREGSRKNLDRALLGEHVVESAYSGEPGPARRYFEVAHNPICGTSGEVIGVSVFASDVTERKQAEQVLLTTFRRFQIILSSLFGGILVVDDNDRVEFVNQAFCELFDLVDLPEHLLGSQAPEIIQRIEAAYADPPAALARIREIVARGQPLIGEEIAMVGQRVYIRDSIPIIIDGKQYGRIWHHRDITERKRMEDALRETNEYLENLFNYANAPIIVWDPHFKITRFNHAFESLTGRSAAQVLGQPLDRLFPPDQIKASMQLIQKTLTGERWEVVEINIQHVDGSIRTVLWNSATLFSVDGQTPLATIAQGQDITERKQSQGMLQVRLRLVEFAANHTLSELLTQTLDEVCTITASPIGFYDFVEPDQKTLSHQTWSTRTLQEYCQAQGSGEHFTFDDAGVWVDAIRLRKAVIHNDYASLPHRKGLPAGHAPLIRELVVPIFRDDLIVAILGVGNRAQEYTEKDIEVVAFFADVAWEIARRKRVEETLRESEERFHSLFENMLNGFAYCRMLIEEGRPPDFIYLEVNRAFGTLTGLKDVVGKKASEAIPGIQVTDPELLERYARVSQTGVPESFETYVEALHMWFSISVYSPQQGYFVAVFDVITDRKRAEQELQAYSEYLEDMVNERTRALQDAQEKMVRSERLATLGQLAGSVGHELRNPLGVISNAVYFLKMTQPDASPTILDYLDIIDKETRISDKIVTDLLDFTRIKSVEREPAAVSDLFTQTLQRYHVPSVVEVSLQLPPSLPPVFADPRQVVQVLGNLVTNACQAMLEPQTGSTTLSTPDGVPRVGKLTLSASLQGDMIAIAVQDTGMGIPPENMGKLFEPLFTTKTKGIGLGLAVSQKLTEANGGRIEAHSQPGQGSTFAVYLPAYRSESDRQIVNS
jgi:PAS domain S-box-containing protein